MENLNLILEIINGNVSILTLILLVWLGFYISDRTQKLNSNSFSKLLSGVPAGLALAVYLYIEQLGTVITRLVVWFWRMEGGNTLFSHLQAALLGVGAFLMGLGILFMIRLLSKPRFGDLPWIYSCVIAITYTTLRLAAYFS